MIEGGARLMIEGGAWVQLFDVAFLVGLAASMGAWAAV
jgi:hypothetical protein